MDINMFTFLYICSLKSSNVRINCFISPESRPRWLRARASWIRSQFGWKVHLNKDSTGRNRILNLYLYIIMYFTSQFSTLIGLRLSKYFRRSHISIYLHSGPGWFPGLPRLGDNDSCPEIPERQKHYSSISGLTHLYLVIQLLGVFIVHDDLSRYVQGVNRWRGNVTVSDISWLWAPVLPWLWCYSSCK